MQRELYYIIFQADDCNLFSVISSSSSRYIYCSALPDSRLNPPGFADLNTTTTTKSLPPHHLLKKLTINTNLSEKVPFDTAYTVLDGRNAPTYSGLKSWMLRQTSIIMILPQVQNDTLPRLHLSFVQMYQMHTQ